MNAPPASEHSSQSLDLGPANYRDSRRSRHVDRAIVVAFSLVASLWFCNKAFHIDDPLYLSIARQILADPLHPFDGEINWQQVTEPAWQVSISPPGYSYWLAGWMAIGVWGERGLHAAASIWVVVLGLATYEWARRLGSWPLAATLLVVTGPLVVAGTNLMLDIPMLALAAAAIAVYLRASDRNSASLALVAGLLAGMSVNVKYAGVVAIAVMSLDSIVWRRWRLLAAPAMGLAMLFFVQWTVANKNGVPQLVHAREWITSHWPSDWRDALHRTSSAVMYLGSSAAWLFLLAGSCVNRPWHGFAAAVISCIGTALVIADVRQVESNVPVPALIYAGAFAFAGWFALAWLGLRITGAARSTGVRTCIHSWRAAAPDAGIRHGFMLLVWTCGFWYLGTLNGPFVAPRAMLPCVFSLVLAVLVLAPQADSVARFGIRFAVIATMIAGVLVGWGDYRWADTYRTWAPQLAAKYRPANGTLYFLGHWGWQHYAAAAGMVQWDPSRMRLHPGDVVILPRYVDCPLPLSLVLRGCREIAREPVLADRWLPRTRCPEDLIFLYGDTAGGRIPWGWSLQTANGSYEVFYVFQFASYGE